MSKKWMAALAVPVLAVTGVSVASAQSADETPDTDPSADGTTDETAEEAGHRHGRRGRGVGRLAEAIGVEASDLREAIEGGQTIADVASENGVDIDQVIGDLVAEAQTKADEAGRDDFDADALTERLTAAVNGEVDFSERGGRHGRGLRGASEAVESLLGLEGEAIRDAVQGGQTLAEVAEDQGVSLDELVSTIVDDIETRLSESDRGLPEDFDEDALTERVTERVTSDAEDRQGRRGPGRRGFGGPGFGPDAADDAAETTAA